MLQNAPIIKCVAQHGMVIRRNFLDQLFCTALDRAWAAVSLRSDPINTPEVREMNTVPPLSHSAVPALTVDRAHRIMQEHIDCPITVCLLKSQAKSVLVDNERLVPADRLQFGL
ncbi:hypothetical protein [Nocardia sp. NPDC051750]|uniref:hypothetical protein n=1 Tax=Nocardia sp. NPDC051750 TaxID=3364325 RepID=UPI0037BDDA12